jgi:hypothetical protein
VVVRGFWGILGGRFVTKAEKETVIRWDEEEEVVTVFTCSRLIWRQLDGVYGWQKVAETRGQAGRLESMTFRGPLRLFSFTAKRAISEETKARLVSQGVRTRFAQKPRLR